MSFRIEEKLYIKPEHLLDFREYLSKNLSQKLHHPRKIKSLYFLDFRSDPDPYLNETDPLHC